MNGYHIFSLKNENAMYKRLADFFFRMTFSHVHYLSKFEKKILETRLLIYKYNLLKKHLLYYLILRLFTDQTLIKFVY